MREGEFTDTGYRFRYESYNRTDADYFDPWKETLTESFYSLQLYNHDTFSINESKSEKYFFAELFYRLESD